MNSSNTSKTTAKSVGSTQVSKTTTNRNPTPSTNTTNTTQERSKPGEQKRKLKKS